MQLLPPKGFRQARSSQSARCGYTVVELMVTIVIVSILAATLGVLFARLLTIQEREREEAYVREALTDVCAAYADMLSVGSSFGTRSNLLSHAMDVRVNYRHETGGISLETSVVTRVAHLDSVLNATNKTVDLGAYSFERGDLVRRLSRIAKGDAALIPLAGDMVSLTITPLDETALEDKGDGFRTTNAALGYLEATARYKVRNDDGEYETKTATAGRVVRLWNRE